MYFARDCKNLASTKKHLAMDLLLSSALFFGPSASLRFLFSCLFNAVLSVLQVVKSTMGKGRQSSSSPTQNCSCDAERLCY